VLLQESVAAFETTRILCAPVLTIVGLRNSNLARLKSGCRNFRAGAHRDANRQRLQQLVVALERGGVLVPHEIGRKAICGTFREGTTLIERRNTFEFMRDEAAELFETHTGSAWRPRAGSMVNHRTLTAVIDSRDLLAAGAGRDRDDAAARSRGGVRRRLRVQRPSGDLGATRRPRRIPRHGPLPVAERGGLHRGLLGPAARKVPQIAFRPDFMRHKNAAPFKRNDKLLEALPIGIVVFPGSGISDNLADKARKLGIPLLDYRKSGGA
jgi:hypothetical protein